MNKKTREYRKAIADAFVKSLTEDPQHWKQMWQGNMRPINGHTGRKYTGLNRFWLQHMMYEKNYDDPRFYTFKQVQDMGLKVKKGSKAVQVEFWSLYDPETKKTVSFSEAADYEPGVVETSVALELAFERKRREIAGEHEEDGDAGVHR